MENNTTNNQVTGYTFLNTVQSNKSYFHRCEIKGFVIARLIQQLVGWLSSQALKKAVGKHQIINCPITIDNTNGTEAIYGPHIPIFHENYIRGSSEHHMTIQRIPLPPPHAKHHQHV